MPSGTSTGILNGNNSKKKKTAPKQQGGRASAAGQRPSIVAPSTAGLGILGKDPEDVKPPLLRDRAQMQGSVGSPTVPEELLASMALQRRTSEQNIVPSGGGSQSEDHATKVQKKRNQRQKPSAVSAV